MSDQPNPHAGRGGSYVVDRKTGKRTRVAYTEPALVGAAERPPAPRTAQRQESEQAPEAPPKPTKKGR